MNKKILIALYSVSGALLIFLLSLLIFFKVRTQKSNLVYNGENLFALNRAAKKSECKNPKKSFMYYGFTESQRAHLQNFVIREGGASFTFCFENNQRTEGENVVSAAFLYRDDFKSKNHLKRVLNKRPLVSADFSKTQENKIELLFAISPEEEIPCGFFVHGSGSYKLDFVAEKEVQFGFCKNYENQNLTFAFSSDGGTADFSFNHFDFSQAKSIFCRENEFAPFLEIYMTEIHEIGSPKNQPALKAKFGDESLNIRRTKKINLQKIQCAAYKNPYSNFEIENGLQMFLGVMMKKNQNLLAKEFDFSPVKTDLGLILDWNQDTWRCEDYEIFEWEEFNGVLIFDFKNYFVQNEFFTRLAYFVEKAGFKGTLVSDDFVYNRHGYNAHDYKAEDLAKFFNLAEKENFPLNQNELKLRQILLFNKIILPCDSGEEKFTAGKGAVISISRESPEYLRWQLLAHESWHGIYFTNENFRNAVAAIYNMFDEKSFEFIKVFWETQPGLGYDTKDEYLMQNEFMAYIMQTNSPREYFLNFANRPSVNRIEGDLAAYVRETKAEAFAQAGDFLNTYAFDNWGLACGRSSLVTK